MKKSFIYAGGLYLVLLSILIAIYFTVNKEASFVIVQREQTSTERTVDEMLPKAVRIEVPFTSQAPFGNWDDPYQEACEEASLIMVQRYYSERALTAEQADEEIVNVITWENFQNLPQDITVQQLARVADEYYSMDSELVYDPTIEELEQYIANGQPVIVPAAGRMLGNPYFSGDGPWYHMLVLIGYDEKNFITNDPGTRKGKSYAYKKEVLMESIHNWTGVKEDIQNGERVVLILSVANQQPSLEETIEQ